jgi:hypothetical protein
MKNEKLVYDKSFIESILDGKLDSYGENCESTISINDLTEGRNNFYSSNEETIKQLIKNIVS